MGEEEDIRVSERLMDVSVTHKLLISESLIGFFLLILRDDLRGGEFWGLCDGLGYQKLEVTDLVLQDRDSLQWGNDQVSQYVTVPIG